MINRVSDAVVPLNMADAIRPISHRSNPLVANVIDSPRVTMNVNGDGIVSTLSSSNCSLRL